MRPASLTNSVNPILTVVMRFCMWRGEGGLVVWFRMEGQEEF